MDSKKLTICIRYMAIISEMFVDGMACDDERTELHGELLEIFGFQGLDIEAICSRLDIWLGIPDTSKKLSPADIAKYGQRLYDLLTSDWVKENGWSEQEEEFKRLRAAWYDDPDFDGWKEKTEPTK